MTKMGFCCYWLQRFIYGNNDSHFKWQIIVNMITIIILLVKKNNFNINFC